MDLIDRFFSRTPKSADTARERLRFVLAYDRSDFSPETLEVLKDEIVGVLSRHVDVDREQVEIKVSRVANVDHLVASIPVIRSDRPHAKAAPRRTTRRASAK
jgi:cell division topological specificity factor